MGPMNAMGNVPVGSKYQLRDLAPDELDDAIELVTFCFADGPFASLHGHETMARHNRHRIDNASLRLGAFAGGWKLVGFVLLESSVPNGFWDRHGVKDVQEVGALAVHPQWRRQGVARNLIAAAAQRAKARVVAATYPDAPHSETLFSGWERLGEYRNGFGLVVVCWSNSPHP